MPQYIQRFCGDHINSMELQYKVARTKVARGAVALGENHNEPYARAILCDLIDAGCVTKLFLELHEYGIGESLRDEMLGTDISKNPKWVEVQRAINRETRANNPIRETTLISLAVTARVKVYFFDEYQGPHGHTSEVMKVRNQDMGKVFANNASAAEAGVVLLNGAKHFQPLHSGGRFEHTIQSICDIHPFQAIDLRNAGRSLVPHQQPASQRSRK